MGNKDQMIEAMLYIDGQFQKSESGKFFEVVNPSHKSVIGIASDASEGEVTRALNRAKEAFSTYKNTTAYQRANWLRKLHGLVVASEAELARTITLEQGKPLAEALGEVRYAASYIQWYAEEGIRIKGDLLETHQPDQRLMVLKEPIGAVGIITPWNFPLAMFVRKLAPALAAGCTVVVKPAEQTPLTAALFFGLIHQVGFEPGVCQMITGDGPMIGRAMMAHRGISKVSFTGSTEVGQLLASQSGTTLKKLSLELGGHAPFIVFEDCDLEGAVTGLMDGKFRNCGQTCVAVNRVFVQRSIASKFEDMVAQRVKGLRAGDGFGDVELGPIIDQAGYEKIVSHVEDALEQGAVVAAQGTTEGADLGRGSGLFYPATLLTGITPKMRLFSEETFGPLVPLILFDTEEEAIQMANDTPYGLAAYAYTQNLGRSVRLQEALEYGMIGLNTGRISTAQVPFGGVKMSGYGREGGTYGIEEYLTTKYVALGI